MIRIKMTLFSLFNVAHLQKKRVNLFCFVFFFPLTPPPPNMTPTASHAVPRVTTHTPHKKSSNMLNWTERTHKHSLKTRLSPSVCLPQLNASVRKEVKGKERSCGHNPTYVYSGIFSICSLKRNRSQNWPSAAKMYLDFLFPLFDF